MTRRGINVSRCRCASLGPRNGRTVLSQREGVPWYRRGVDLLGFFTRGRLKRPRSKRFAQMQQPSRSRNNTRAWLATLPFASSRVVETTKKSPVLAGVDAGRRRFMI